MLTLIQLMTTSKCSGNCLICPYASSWHKNNPGYMNDEDFENVLQKIKDFEPDFDGQFCPYLMQDPTSDKNIIKRIEKIFQYFPKCYIEISTNAMVLTPKLSEEIIETILKYDKTNRSHIWLSHHAINKETYETLMQRKNYNKTLNNIIEYIMINDGRIKTILRGSGASKDGSLFYFSGEEYQKYWQEIFSKNNLNPESTQIDYFTFHNRAGNVKMKNWEFGDTFSRTIDTYHPFSCNRYVTGLHIMYNSDIVPCCFKGGTLILTQEGLKPIKNIQVDDKVYSHDRKLHTVTETYERNFDGIMPSIRVWNYHEPIQCTPEHPILARKYLGRTNLGNKYGDQKFIEAKHLSKKDLIHVPRIKIKTPRIELYIRKYLIPKNDIVAMNNKVWAIDRWKRTIIKDHYAPLTIKPNRDLMWVFGFYLAEGWIRKKTEEVVFSMNRNELKFANKIIDTLKKYGFGTHHFFTYYREHNLDLTITNRVLSNLLKNLFGTGCEKKAIHDDLMKHNSSRLMSLVHGFGDGDGEIKPERDRLVTTSELLAKQLYLICLRNNTIPGITRQVKKNKRTSYTISITKNGDYRHVKQNNRIEFWYPIREIKGIPFSGKVYNIEVEDTHSYLVNGMYSVHNCMDYSHEYVWGNLKDQSLKEIWHGKPRKDFIDKATGLISSDNDFICSKCLNPGG